MMQVCMYKSYFSLSDYIKWSFGFLGCKSAVCLLIVLDIPIALDLGTTSSVLWNFHFASAEPTNPSLLKMHLCSLNPDRQREETTYICFMYLGPKFFHNFSSPKVTCCLTFLKSLFKIAEKWRWSLLDGEVKNMKILFYAKTLKKKLSTMKDGDSVLTRILFAKKK